MRVANKMGYEQVKANIGKNRQEMLELQNQAATQKRINKPSDDPMAATRVLTSRTEISGTNQYIKNVGQTKGFLEYSEQSLGDVTEQLMRAKEIAINQSNDPSAGPASRAVSANEVEQILSSVVQIANRKFGDRYIYGGYRTNRAPFDRHGTYFGDDGEMDIPVDKEMKVPMNIPGSKIFIGRYTPAHQGVNPTGGAENPDSPESGPSNPKLEHGGKKEDFAVPVRQPTSEAPTNLSETWQSDGVNIFNVLSNLMIGLRSNDKLLVQDSLDTIDEAISQVVLARSQLGWRVNTLNNLNDQLMRNNIQTKTIASNLEDVDTFELVSDMNKSEATLKASLETSGKLIQPSLLDFLK